MRLEDGMTSDAHGLPDFFEKGYIRKGKGVNSGKNIHSG